MNTTRTAKIAFRTAAAGSFARFSIFLFAGVALSMFAAPTPDDGKGLDGTWKPVKAELAGKPMPEAVLKTITLKLDHGRYEVTADGVTQPDSGTVSLDAAAARPKVMKINGVKGPNAGKMFPAIYELDGDTLRICYDLSGAKTPAEFKTEPGTKLYLVMYHRAPAQSP